MYCCIFAMYCCTLRYVLYIASNNTPHPGGKEKNLEKISHFNSGFIRALSYRGFLCIMRPRQRR